MNRSTVIAGLRERVSAVQIDGGRVVVNTPLGPLHTGEVHEWFSEATGCGWLPSITLAAGLAVSAFDRIGHMAWIGRAVWPCPLLLDAHPRMLSSSILIDPSDDRSRLWTIDTALRSPARLCVIADGRGLTLPHTRRLQLAAGAGGGLCLLLRAAHERGVLSAASTRWEVTPAPSESERPRWTVAAIRNKHRPGMEFRAVVEWDDAAGLVHIPPVLERGAGGAAAAS